MSGFFETVSNFFNWVSETVTDIKNLMSAVVDVAISSFEYLKLYLSIVPSWLYTLVIVLIIICIIYLIVGRDG